MNRLRSAASSPTRVERYRQRHRSLRPSAWINWRSRLLTLLEDQHRCGCCSAPTRALPIPDSISSLPLQQNSVRLAPTSPTGGASVASGQWLETKQQVSYAMVVDQIGSTKISGAQLRWWHLRPAGQTTSAKPAFCRPWAGPIRILRQRDNLEVLGLTVDPSNSRSHPAATSKGRTPGTGSASFPERHHRCFLPRHRSVNLGS